MQVGVRGSSADTGTERELSATDDSLLADLSGDGRTTLFHDRNAIYLRSTDGAPPLRLAEGYESARLSPDGKWILAVPSQEPRYPTLIPVGAGDVRRLETAECEFAEWLPDGERILCETPTISPGPFA